MPLLHCNDCHHEYEVSNKDKDKKCDWCGGFSSILENKTALENLIDNKVFWDKTDKEESKVKK